MNKNFILYFQGMASLGFAPAVWQGIQELQNQNKPNTANYLAEQLYKFMYKTYRKNSNYQACDSFLWDQVQVEEVKLTTNDLVNTYGTEHMQEFTSLIKESVNLISPVLNNKHSGFIAARENLLKDNTIDNSIILTEIKKLQSSEKYKQISEEMQANLLDSVNQLYLNYIDWLSSLNFSDLIFYINIMGIILILTSLVQIFCILYETLIVNYLNSKGYIKLTNFFQLIARIKHEDKNYYLFLNIILIIIIFYFLIIFYITY